MSEFSRYFFFNAQCLTILLAFIFSIPLLIRCYPKHMKAFFIYTSVSLIIMIPLFLTLNHIVIFPHANLMNRYSLVFNFGFLGGYLLLMMPDKKGIIILEIFILFILIALIYQVFNSDIFIDKYAFATNHFGLIILSIIYLYKLFNNPPTKNLINYPTFWIVAGVLLCSIICFPIFSLWSYLVSPRNFNIRNDIVNDFILCNLPPFGYIIMFSFFIKSFICSIQEKKTS